jgi:hypothetical protein
MSLAAGTRRQVERFVRPFYVELDGVDTFETVARRSELVSRLLDGRPVDAEYLDLLLLFHGTVKRLGSTAPGSRWWLFLRGLGLADELVGRLAIGLGRWRDAPAGPEEEVLHDAELLEEVGVVACARRIWRAGRKRVDLARALSTLEAGPPAARFRTELGRRLATERAADAAEWIEILRRAAAGP